MNLSAVNGVLGATGAYKYQIKITARQRTERKGITWHVVHYLFYPRGA
jgi:hypothetical protein